MNTYWKVETHGDPIGTVQNLIKAIWAQANLDGILAAVNGGRNARLIEQPETMSEVNPFKPLMVQNLARVVPTMLETRPAARLGALLRPCEMRALIEMSKRASIHRERLVTLCVDCLGTYPLEEYEWRAWKKGSPEGLANEALSFARQGGILAYRYRAACQMCSAPGAQSADLNIHVLGLPARQQILVEADAEETAGWLDLEALTSAPAEPELARQHEAVLMRQAERHHHTMEKVLRTLDDLLPRDVDGLISQLEGCGDCQRCMTVCPICASEFPQREADGRYPRQGIMRWMVSCAGCGMCEQACTSNLPLGVIFASIREKLDAELGYTPGRGWNDALPL